MYRFEIPAFMACLPSTALPVINDIVWGNHDHHVLIDGQWCQTVRRTYYMRIVGGDGAEFDVRGKRATALKNAVTGEVLWENEP